MSVKWVKGKLKYVSEPGDSPLQSSDVTDFRAGKDWKAIGKLTNLINNQTPPLKVSGKNKIKPYSIDSETPSLWVGKKKKKKYIPGYDRNV